MTPPRFFFSPLLLRWCALLLAGLLIETEAQAQLDYVPNAGQWPDGVTYRAEAPGGVLWLERTGWTALERLSGGGHFEEGGPDRTRLAWRGRWIGASGASEGTSPGPWSESEPQQGRYNYYLGNDPTRWAAGLQAHGRVRQHDVWPGVDVRWGGVRATGHPKFDFMVAAGADPALIAWAFEGGAPERLDDGRLQVQHAGGNSYIEKPWAYQRKGSKIIEVACRYVVRKNAVHLELGAYDTALPLVIDPEITFSTYIGSTADNFGTTASNGPNGQLVAAAAVFDAGYPTSAGAVQSGWAGTSSGICDIGLTVFNSQGSGLMYSTYLGGGRADIPHSLAYDQVNGKLVLMGTTGSNDFPTTAGCHQSSLSIGPPVTVNIYGSTDQPQGLDLFVARFDVMNWILDAATYLGGSGADGLNMGAGLKANFGDDYRGQVDIAPDGTVWIATTSTSTDLSLPGGDTNTGGQDALIVGFEADLSDLDYGAFFGGSNDDAAYGLEEKDGLVYVAGGSKSNNLPLPPGSIQTANAGGPADGWVGVFSTASGVLAPQFASYHGGSNYDQVYFVQTDEDGLVYGYGQARNGLPIIGDVYANEGSGQFITCWSPDLSEILWQTTIGTENGSIDISPTAFLVSDCQQIYISGWGGQTNDIAGESTVDGSTTYGLPTTSDAFQSSTDGSDFYLAVLAPGAEDLVYGTFLGGGFSSEHVDGGSSRFDINGTVYQAVCAGCGSFDDFPSTPGAWSSVNPSFNCNMGVFKFELGSLNASIDLENPDAFCTGEEVQFVNNTGGDVAFVWDFGDATYSEEIAPTHLYGIEGDYLVQLIATDTTGCLAPDTAYVEVLVAPDANPQIQPIDPLCLGEQTQLFGSGNGLLVWSPPLGLSATNVADPIASPTTTTTYMLTDIADCGTASQEVLLEVVDVNTQGPGDAQICAGDVVELALVTDDADPDDPTGGLDPDWTYSWFPVAGLNDATAAAPLASPTVTTTYTATVTAPEGCWRTHEVTLDVVSAPPGGSTYPEQSVCTSQSTLLTAGPGSTWQWAPLDGLTTPGAQSTFATPTSNTTYTVTITNICGPGVDSVTVLVLVPEAYVSDGGLICPGDPFPVSAWGAGGSSENPGEGQQFQWTPGILAGSPAAASTAVYPVTTQTFTAYVTDADGCTASAELTVTVLPPPFVNAGPDLRNTWLEPTFLLGDVGSTIDTLWWTPSAGLSCDSCLNPEVLDGNSGVYTLHVIDAAGCRASDEVRLEYYYPLYVPSAFTPGNDGINDGFRPVGDGLDALEIGSPDRGYRFEIWNRWGELIWFTHDPAAYWQGNVHGLHDAFGPINAESGAHYVPTDVYSWRLYFPTEKGRESRQGHVTVIR